MIERINERMKERRNLFCSRYLYRSSPACPRWV